MKEQCMICGSMVEDVTGVCPVCGAALTRSRQIDPDKQMQYENGLSLQNDSENQNVNTYMPSGAPYNTPVSPQSKTFSIISLVCSIVSLFMICVPGLGLILSIAAVVFGIIALVKKHSKVPAVIGVIIGGISLIMALFSTMFNVLFKSVAGTSINGMMSQMMEVQVEGCTKLDDIVFLNPVDNQYYVLYSDGTYQTASDDIGVYESLSYMDYYQTASSADDSTYAVLYIMNQGYEIKDVTIVRLGSEYYNFLVPEDYTPGGIIYYIDNGNNTMDMEGYKLVPVSTSSVEDYN